MSTVPPLLTPVVDNEPRLLFTVKEAARLLGMGRSSVYRLINEGALPARRRGGRIFVRREDLLRFVEELPPSIDG